MNQTKTHSEATPWWRLAILAALIVASWILAIVLLPRLGTDKSASADLTPSQPIVASPTAQSTEPTSGPLTATITPVPTAATATASPTASATLWAYCAATADRLNVRSGPGTSNRILGQLQANEGVTPVARNAEGTWVQVITQGSVQGWVSAEYLRCQSISVAELPIVAVFPTATQTDPAPTLTPRQPTATPQAFANWRGEYYGNASLAGPVLLLRDDAAVDFDWTGNSPATGMPADNFSVRWTRDLSLSSGLYRFQVRVDDGVRLWVDGRLLIDQWHAGNNTYAAESYLSGDRHSIRVEYVEYGGNALISLTWQRTEQTFKGWRGAYYGNANLEGSPILLRDDQEINFDWGYGSPAQDIPADRFSVRWTRRVTFGEGRYRFRLEADDGVRLWVAGNLIIDRWKGGYATSTADQRIWKGTHEIVLEYYELEGIAKARLTWEKLSEATTPTSGVPTVTPMITEWRAEYWNNDRLEGTPRLVRNEYEIVFSWRNGGPAPQIGNDHFSARYTRDIYLPAGIYRWSAAADDAVRVYIDGQLVIDAWQEGPLTEHIREVPLSEGNHAVRIEYKDKTGYAALYVHWEKLVPTSTPTVAVTPPTSTPTSTSLPPTATLSPTSELPTVTTTVVPATATPTQEFTMTPPPTSSLPTATPTDAPGQSVAWRTIWQGNRSFNYVKNTTYKVFESRTEWDAWVESQGGQPVVLPGIDWASRVVIAAFLEPQLDTDPDGSILAVEITGMGVTPQGLVIQVGTFKVVPPDRGRGGEAKPVDGRDKPRNAPGTPYHIVAISRAELPSTPMVPVLFTDALGRVVGTDTFNADSSAGPGLQPPPGVRKAKDTF